MNNSASINLDNPPLSGYPSNSITENEPSDNVLNEKEISVNLNDPSNSEIELPFKLEDPRLNIKLNLINRTPSDSDTEFEPDDLLYSEEFPPIDQSIDNQLLEAAITGEFSSVKDMVLQDPEVLLGTTSQGSTCLHISSIFGHQKFSDDVLAQNKSLDLLSSINLHGETPLIVAVINGHVPLAFSLLKLYKQQNLTELILKQDNNENNALHYAIRNGHCGLAQELIVAESVLSHEVNKYNESPMYIAVKRGFKDVTKRLLDIPLSSHVGPNNENALHAAVIMGNEDIVELILGARSLLARKVDKDGHTPLHQAAFFNKLDMIRVLLKHDRSLGYLVSLNSGTPLLNSAAFRGNVGMAQVILKYCPDAPYCDRDGWTMLHQAVNEGHEKFVEFIIKNPQLYKLINMRDKDGDTALHIAIQKFNPKIVRLLLTHKAIDLTALDKNGNPPEFKFADATERAKTLNWNEVMMMMLNANPQALTMGSRQQARKEIKDKSNEEIKSLTSAYTKPNSLVAILIATITFAAAFSLPGGYSIYHENEGLPVLTRKPAFKAFLISDTLAMCSSLVVAFIYILARWEDLEFLLYYRSVTEKLMWLAYVSTTVAFATGLYTVLEPRILWLAILICVLSIGLPFLTYLLSKWPIVMLRYRLGRAFKPELLDLLDMV